MADSRGRCIRVDCSQASANYKKPMSVDTAESYKLPPYSTVIGFVHAACGFTEYKPMSVSVQGTYGTLASDSYTRYFMGIPYETPSNGKIRHQLKVSNPKGGFDGITRGLGYNELVIDVKLVLHIRPDNEADFDAVLNGLKNPANYPSLGRFEDLLYIENVKVVETRREKEFTLRRDAYVPERLFTGKKPPCTSYRLNKVYTLSKDKKSRIWEKEDVLFCPKGGELLDMSDGALAEADSETGIFFA